jgi:hypothetical protein
MEASLITILRALEDLTPLLDAVEKSLVKFVPIPNDAVEELDEIKYCDVGESLTFESNSYAMILETEAFFNGESIAVNDRLLAVINP